MKHALAIATLLLVPGMTAPAFAAQIAQAAAPAQAQPETPATIAGKPDFETVMSSIKASKNSTKAIQSLSAVNTVNIVKLSDLAQGTDMTALDMAIADNQADITGLQAAIMANNPLSMKLDESSIETSDIVAAAIEPDGSVTVFVNRR